MVVLSVLYAGAIAALVLYGANLFWLAWVHARRDGLRSRAGCARTPGARSPWPTITVQIPLYNEALVAESVIDACARLDYPGLEIQVLDDSVDDTTAIVGRRVRFWQARGIDICHLRRGHRQEYKAGALAYGLSRAKGELVAVFDADFVPDRGLLRRLVPCFSDGRIGMVQARWSHLNADESVLTRVQAYGLDAHFAIEQTARMQAGCFINFNGTAGIWRRSCIEDAGGWQGDTLAEDLDLSYRAQLRGWQFRILSDVEAPAELPRSLQAYRAQQFRWTKGASEAAIKLLTSVWRSRHPARVKLEGSLHLTSSLVYPALVVAMLLHAPLLRLEHVGIGPGPVYFAAMGLGLVGFLGFFLVQALAQRALYPEWPRRLLFFPVFMAGSMGLAINNSVAVWQAARRRKSAFVRTPKYNTSGTTTWWRSRYAYMKISLVTYLELLFALYSLAGLAILLIQQDWAAGVFQTCFAAAFVLVSFYNLREAWLQLKTGLPAVVAAE